MDSQALIDRLRALRPKLAAAGVVHLAMFGSRARGDHRADSDLDLLIDVEAAERFSLLDLIGVQHTIGDELGLPVNAMMRRSLSDRFRSTVERDIRDIF